MFLILASGVAALSAAASPMHSAEISHSVQAYTASYHAQSAIRAVEPVAVAQQDRAPLVGELDSVRALSTQGAVQGG